MRVIQQELFQTAFLVATADPPDSGPITFQASGYDLDRIPGGDSQHDPSMLNLKPSEATTVGHSLKNRSIRVCDTQPAGFASTHRPPSGQSSGLPSAYSCTEFVA
jgi:hypothetical protein